MLRFAHRVPNDLRRSCAEEPPKDRKEVKAWSDSSGKYKIEATFVELVDDKLVVLKRASDEKIIKVPLDKLDEESKSQACDSKSNSVTSRSLTGLSQFFMTARCAKPLF